MKSLFPHYTHALSLSFSLSPSFIFTRTLSHFFSLTFTLFSSFLSFSLSFSHLMQRSYAFDVKILISHEVSNFLWSYYKFHYITRNYFTWPLIIANTFTLYGRISGEVFFITKLTTRFVFKITEIYFNKSMIKWISI